MIVLLEPPTHTENSPAPTVPEMSDIADMAVRHEIPGDLAALVTRGRRDPRAQRELADALLVRHWSPDAVADALDLGRDTVRALSRVRRPGTAASHVAAELVPHPRTVT